MAANRRRLAALLQAGDSSESSSRHTPESGRLGKAWQPGDSSLEFAVKHGKTTEQAGPPWTFQGAYVVLCLWLLCMTSGWVILSMYGIDKVVGAKSSIFAPIRRPNLLHKRLQVLPKNMSLPYRCRMASIFHVDGRTPDYQ